MFGGASRAAARASADAAGTRSAPLSDNRVASPGSRSGRVKTVFFSPMLHTNRPLGRSARPGSSQPERTRTPAVLLASVGVRGRRRRRRRGCRSCRRCRNRRNAVMPGCRRGGRCRRNRRCRRGGRGGRCPRIGRCPRVGRCPRPRVGRCPRPRVSRCPRWRRLVAGAGPCRILRRDGRRVAGPCLLIRNRRALVRRCRHA
jgi:hypothetical protein